MNEARAEVVQGAVRQRPGEGPPELVADRRVVAGAVDRPGHRDEHRIATGHPRRCDLVDAVLRLVVPADEAAREVAPVGLVDDLAAGVAEHVDRAHVDDPRHADRDRGLDPPLDGGDVDAPHLVALVVPDADPVVAGQRRVTQVQ